MKNCFVMLLLMMLFSTVQAQEVQITEQQMENQAEQDETEDDSYLQHLEYYLKHPINLNTITETGLKEFNFISALQIDQLLKYRRLLGAFLSIYELQAVPTWDLALIQRLLPYISISSTITVRDDFKMRLQKGEHTILTRMSYVPEKAEGFSRKNDTAATNFYLGSREKSLIRYKYQYKHLLQYGITAEKDPGEQWFKGAQKLGFDFYSAHLFVRNVGIIQQFAIGDYTVNLGQGLIQWQSLAFRKSGDITNIKRQATVLRPFNAASEYLFNRGAGITIGKNRFQVTAFASTRKLSATVYSDTVQGYRYFSSINVSGLHRTPTEQFGKNTVQMNSFGGNMSFKQGAFHLGLNGLYTVFSLSYQKEIAPYNQLLFRGKQYSHLSVDWSYTFGNLHWFGESAVFRLNKLAVLSGVLISTDPKLDLSFIYRYISKGYQTIAGNAFTESASLGNETGFFAGLSYKQGSKWRLDAYTDLYRFPFLKFRVDAPSTGVDYFIQITHKPSKQIELYTRFKQESKSLNYTAEGVFTTAAVDPIRKRNWRTQVQYKINLSLMLRYRLDAVWYDEGGPAESHGFLSFIDFFYKPPLKPIHVNLRWLYFETNSSDSRVYAYENDVLYGFSIPSFAGKGKKYYININYDISSKCSVWLKWSQLINAFETIDISGLDDIPGKLKTELKFQLLIKL